MDVAAAQEEASSSSSSSSTAAAAVAKPPRAPDLLMSPEIETEIETWHITGVPPFPELLQCPRNGWFGLARSDLRLIHHIIGLSIDLHRRGFSTCTVWAQKMPNFLAIALSNDYVMSSILALSASHLAWITHNQETTQLAYHHRATAFRGLKRAIGAFSKDNSDALLAASILLSWQATEWNDWALLQKGLSTILDAMLPIWKQESDLARFLESQRALAIPAVTAGYPSPQEDPAHLDQTIAALQNVQKQVGHNQEHYRRLEDLLDFVRRFRRDLPMQTPETAFERMQTLRQWLFWLPPAMLRGGDSDMAALPVLAQFFGIGVALDRVVPELGGAYLAPLSIGPADDMYRIVVSRSSSDPFNPEIQHSLALMDLPRHIVAQHKNRLHWSPRPSIDPYSPASSSPYPALHDYGVAPPSTSSPSSTSPTYATYASPGQSPPPVAVPSSPFPVVGNYVTTTTAAAPAAAPSQAYYPPPSPQLLTQLRTTRADLSGYHHHHGQAGTLPRSPVYSPTYVDDMFCGGVPRVDGTPLGSNMGLYHTHSPESHAIPSGGLMTPELWT
ncbi:hypothetical protein ASPZODRAFT_133578 [Penicilliopsis zonata CBS 506.65]|uniref:Uncharacterized protein n=1 Tax=Penicilliopsis zonata CBS 506.65 TaxID=1073090 RepID=A0A1L9SF26_9EURO|nr:hypothetical protein ASPZODRAFT_133578 [Penicilliopsis zonata CBS 506.65]OJJ45713.1 hypothetical protein ASPZODRAFT_133578 [Penicilliopsis zonata CBS 506.65]